VAVTAFLVAFGAAPRIAAAQASATDQSVAPFSSFYITAGTILMNVSDLNFHFERPDIDSASKRPGFPTIANHGYTMGAGFYFPVLGKYMLGAEANFGDMGYETSPNAKSVKMTTRYWMATMGYAVLTTWNFTLAPFVGIGTGSATVTLTQRGGGTAVSPSQAPTFDEVIAQPGSRSELVASYVIVQPGFALDFLNIPSTDGHVGVTMGLRVSSSISPHRATWTYQGHSVFGGPDLGPVGGSIRLVGGIGGFRLAGSPGARR
jgi:hypothetical protein